MEKERVKALAELHGALHSPVAEMRDAALKRVKQDGEVTTVAELVRLRRETDEDAVRKEVDAVLRSLKLEGAGEALLDVALDRIQDLGGGVLIYLRSGFVGVPLEKLVDQSKEDERRAQWLEIGVGAQILRDLGLSRIRLIAGREVDYVGVEGFGLVLESTELLND